ncbi:SAM-dependent methyltransferase [Deinococcus cavernae]|nr:class I SAM-dependent methyltransferase [Deinococcus cavernae]
MNFLEFFAIAEQDRDILNPIGREKLEQVAAYAGLRDGLSVLDVGSGKGALLRQWARNWDIRGVGLELNPAFVQQARELTQAAGLTEKLSFWEGKALDFPVKVAGYDVVVCLGATFAIGTFSEAVAWMGAHVKPGGVLIVGDVVLNSEQAVREAPQNLVGWSHLPPTLAGRCQEFQTAGVELIGLSVSSTDDWDHYTSLMWSAVDRWAAQNPEHPNRTEVLQNVQEGKVKYLNWEREHLGWAVMVGRVTG